MKICIFCLNPFVDRLRSKHHKYSCSISSLHSFRLELHGSWQSSNVITNSYGMKCLLGVVVCRCGLVLHEFASLDHVVIIELAHHNTMEVAGACHWFCAAIFFLILFYTPALLIHTCRPLYITTESKERRVHGNHSNFLFVYHLRNVQTLLSEAAISHPAKCGITDEKKAHN